MYPQPYLTPEEQTIVFRIRQLIGDSSETFVDDLASINSSNRVMVSGTMYQLEEPKGYPTEIYVNGVEYTTSGNPSVIGYKYLKFSSNVLLPGSSLTVIYNHFRHADLEIIDTYDTSATTYLANECGLGIEDLGPDLLILATAYILLNKDLNIYLTEAIELQDSDSRYSSSTRAGTVRAYLKDISDYLKSAIEAKTRCKMFSLPIYKVE